MEYWATAPCHAEPGQTHAEAIRELLDAVEFADALGLDGWFSPELRGLPAQSLDSSPHLLIAAASRTTSRIRVGTMVDLIGFHHPLRVAEEVRFLDTLTRGRLEVGVGPGGSNEHERWGTDASEGRDRFEVAFSLLRRFLEGDLSDYETPWWRGRISQLTPEPVQAPHPPLWLATISGGSVERAARWGINCQSGLGPRDVHAERLATFRACWAAHHPGTPTGRFAAMVDVVVNDDARVAREAGEQFRRRRIERRHRSAPVARDGAAAGDERRTLTSAFAELSYAELIEQGWAVCGDVEECAVQLARLAAIGIDVVTTWMPFGDVDAEVARRSLHLLCEEVVPRVGPAPVPAAVR
jgi:alkanesulfonate monooxygenase SsuD/methylene tetrahydromethanopterin reductase-like flavin-dependent oxidoreductase (luciferase family)